MKRTTSPYFDKPSLAKRVKKVERKVNSRKPELKKISGTIVQNGLPTHQQVLSQVAEGTGPDQRIGNKIRLKKLELRLPAITGRYCVYIANKNALDNLIVSPYEASDFEEDFWVIKDKTMDTLQTYEEKFVRNFGQNGVIVEFDAANATSYLSNPLKFSAGTGGGNIDIKGWYTIWYEDN